MDYITFAKRKLSGLTLIELIISAAVLAIAITALFGAFLGQTVLNEHARNVSWAMNDANRVMERLRQQNTGCSTPTSAAPAGFPGWDGWLADTSTSGGGGKSLPQNPAVNELIVVTCQNRTGTAACTSGTDPVRLTVAVCWRHRNRTLGECAWSGTQLTVSEGSNGFASNGVIESTAMLSTLMTCR